VSHHEGRRQVTITIPVPLADMIESYKKSEIAKHVRGIQREVLLTVRSLIDARIQSLADNKSTESEKAETARKVEVK